MRFFYLLLSGFMFTWSLFFLAEYVRDFFTGEAYWSAIVGGSIMGALAVYWLSYILEEI